MQQLVKGGFAALGAGDRATAIEYCRQVIRERPDMARGHYLAGLIALDSNDIVAAEKAFATTVQLNDKHAGGWAQLAKLYVLGGEFVKADGCLKNAVLTTRGNANVQDLIGSAYRLAGNYRASLEWHAKAVSTATDHVPFQINYANALLYSGDADGAAKQLDHCLAQEPANAMAHWLLSRARTAENAQHIDAMDALLVKPANLRATAYLNYAVGKEHEDLESWDAAFKAYDVAAKARRQCVAYDEEADDKLFACLSEIFTKAWMASQAGACNSRVPIFILGQPRTGTTLLDRMLDAHPAVTSAGELRHFGLAVRRVSGRFEIQQFSEALMLSAANADMTAIGETYVASLDSLRGNAAHVVDKLPSNFLHLPLLLAALPNARILHMRRDPMDTCFAVFKTLFAGAYLHSYTQAEMARHFVRYFRFMETMRERFADRFIDVDYEQLVDDTEETLRTALEFCGLSWNERCLNYLDSDSAVATQSAAQVRELPHNRSIGRWRRYAEHLEPTREVLAAAGISIDE